MYEQPDPIEVMIMTDMLYFLLILALIISLGFSIWFGYKLYKEGLEKGKENGYKAATEKLGEPERAVFVRKINKHRSQIYRLININRFLMKKTDEADAQLKSILTTDVSDAPLSVSASSVTSAPRTATKPQKPREAKDRPRTATRTPSTGSEPTPQLDIPIPHNEKELIDDVTEKPTPHPTYPNVVSSGVPGEWAPAPGYEWDDDSPTPKVKPIRR